MNNDTHTTMKAFIKFGGAREVINGRTSELLAQTGLTGAAFEALDSALDSADLNVYESEFSGEAVTHEEAESVVLYTFEQSIIPALHDNLKYGDTEFDDVDDMVDTFGNLLLA
tara:strand:- start:279 stop:617 length:339 start_codon:yes stop_codon:yes gene_type:complete